MIELGAGINPELEDATFDLDGTVFKFTVIEAYINWLCGQGIFDPLPPELTGLRKTWKIENTEVTYKPHLDQLVGFFIKQVEGKKVSLLAEAANIVATQENYRRWNVVEAIIEELRDTHNVISISLMPEWLMEPFTRDLGFVALIGSTYVDHEGVFTDEAYSIDKAEAYAEARGGDASKLDVHMGDTTGDASLFLLARRPIPFNPTGELTDEFIAPYGMSSITSEKNMATVLDPPSSTGEAGSKRFRAPFDAEAILSRINPIRP